jgi:hypothetical protein
MGPRLRVAVRLPVTGAGYPTGMYVIPLIVLVIIAVIAVAWSPIFAVVFAVLGFLVFAVYIGMRPRADETEPVHPNAPATRPSDEDLSHGVWGEK